MVVRQETAIALHFSLIYMAVITVGHSLQYEVVENVIKYDYCHN